MPNDFESEQRLAEQTSLNRDTGSLRPTAIDTDDLPLEEPPPRLGIGPLLSIGSIVAMACALPVLGWASHRSTSPSVKPTEVAAAAAPGALAAGSAGAAESPSNVAAKPSTASEAGSIPSSLLGFAIPPSEKTHRKRAPGKHGSPRAGETAASEAQGNEGAREDSHDSLEAAREGRGVESAAERKNAAKAARVRSHAGAPPVEDQAAASAPAHASGPSVEDQAAAELSAALK